MSQTSHLPSLLFTVKFTGESLWCTALLMQPVTYCFDQWKSTKRKSATPPPLILHTPPLPFMRVPPCALTIGNTQCIIVYHGTRCLIFFHKKHNLCTKGFVCSLSSGLCSLWRTRGTRAEKGGEVERGEDTAVQWDTRVRGPGTQCNGHQVQVQPIKVLQKENVNMWWWYNSFDGDFC